jgi:antibiotic biosynthesis monooxygenase (ABM) superfamily enzyme
MVKCGEEEEYEHWLRQMLEAVSRFPGYLGSEIFQPAQDAEKRTSVVRFDSNEHLNAWVQSDVHRAFVERVKKLVQTVDMREIMVGIDFSFIPEIRRPKPWKQFLITLSAVYPLTLVIPVLIHQASKLVPFLGDRWIQGVLRATTLVAVLVFLITPSYTRLVRRWLYKDT